MFHTDAGRTAGTRPLQCRGVAPGHRTAKAPAKGLSALNSMAFGLAVYASQCGLPRPTQDSLPAAGQALPGGLFTRKVPLRDFRGVIVTSHPPYPSLLGAIDVSSASNASTQTCFGESDRSRLWPGRVVAPPRSRTGCACRRQAYAKH